MDKPAVQTICEVSSSSSSIGPPPGLSKPIYKKELGGRRHNKEIWILRNEAKEYRDQYSESKTTIYVGNLSKKVTKAILRIFFCKMWSY